MNKVPRRPLRSYWQPRYWPAWLAMILLWLSCWLPYRWQMGLGRALGRLGHRFVGTRRAIARRNIEICFPELAPAERDALALRHFEALGCSLMEWALGRWASTARLSRLTKLNGVEHVQNALNEGRGVILLSAHFTSLEISGRVFRELVPPFDAVYRPFRNPMMTELIASGREKSARRIIEKNDIKEMIRSLREGIAVWYAPDQAYSQKQSSLLEFFGEPAMTNIATTTLAKLGNAVAVPYFSRRLPEGGYVIDILPPIEGLPSDDALEDTRKYLALLEQQVRKCPEQYYWVHRRFKNRPASLPDAYADLDSLK